MWLMAMTAPPVAGTCSVPVMSNRMSSARKTPLARVMTGR